MARGKPRSSRRKNRKDRSSARRNGVSKQSREVGGRGGLLESLRAIQIVCRCLHFRTRVDMWNGQSAHCLAPSRPELLQTPSQTASTIRGGQGLSHLHPWQTLILLPVRDGELPRSGFSLFMGTSIPSMSNGSDRCSDGCHMTYVVDVRGAGEDRVKNS
jgi:hypothetical protein